MSRRFTALLAAAVAAIGLVVGMADAADAQTGLGNVSASVSCGPLISSADVTVSGGIANATYTESVDLAGITLNSTFTVSVSGSGSGTLTVPASLLGGLINLPVTVSVDGVEVTVNAAVSCG